MVLPKVQTLENPNGSTSFTTFLVKVKAFAWLARTSPQLRNLSRARHVPCRGTSRATLFVRAPSPILSNGTALTVLCFLLTRFLSPAPENRRVPVALSLRFARSSQTRRWLIVRGLREDISYCVKTRDRRIIRMWLTVITTSSVFSMVIWTSPSACNYWKDLCRLVHYMFFVT